jgi:anti-anti-sigma factor
MPPNLRVKSLPSEREDQCVLQVEGRLTIETAPQLQTAMRESRCRGVIIDMSQVSYVDSIGLGALVRAHVSMQTAGGRLALVGVPDRVKLLLGLLGLDPVLLVYETLTAAQEALG